MAGDELVHERVAAQVHDARVRLPLEHPLADRLEQVRLAQADAAVDEQRVVRLARLLADGLAGRVRQAVARAGHELVERVVGVERQRHVAVGVDTRPRGRRSQWKLTATSRPVTAWAAAVNGCLALALAEVQLGRRFDRDLDHAVRQLPGHHLVEPDAVDACWARTAARTGHTVGSSTGAGRAGLSAHVTGGPTVADGGSVCVIVMGLSSRSAAPGARHPAHRRPVRWPRCDVLV